MTARGDPGALRAEGHAAHQECVSIKCEQAAASLAFQIMPFPAALVRGHVVQPFGGQDHVAIVGGGTGRDHFGDAEAVLEIVGAVVGGFDGHVTFLDTLGLFLQGIVAFGDAIRFGDKTKSTDPAVMALIGMEGHCAVFGSWAKVTPPTALMAFSP